VGDYTRRLAGELVRQGHPCVILALNDSDVNEAVFETQRREDAAIPVLRLPRMTGLANRVILARKWLGDLKPDWISLQYVCYGFHPKGLAWRWNAAFSKLNGLCSRRHLSLHELWIEPPPLRHWFIGMGQRLIIRDLCARVCPRIVTTTIPLYKRWLSGLGVAAELLPLFGNIPKTSRDDGHVAKLLQKAGSVIVQRPRSTFLNGVLFGGVQSPFNPGPLNEWLAQLQSRSNKSIILSFVGRNGPGCDGLVKSLVGNERRNFEVILLGEQSVDVISQVLQYADFGISTCGSKRIGKSGTFAAMREHGLPVVLADGEIDPALQRSGPPVLQFSADGSVDAAVKPATSLLTELGLKHTAGELLRLWKSATA
jgi:hypothetical protein